jgi:hypothetical protein
MQERHTYLNRDINRLGFSLEWHPFESQKATPTLRSQVFRDFHQTLQGTIIFKEATTYLNSVTFHIFTIYRHLVAEH